MTRTLFRIDQESITAYRSRAVPDLMVVEIGEALALTLTETARKQLVESITEGDR